MLIKSLGENMKLKFLMIGMLSFIFTALVVSCEPSKDDSEESSEDNNTPTGNAANLPSGFGTLSTSSAITKLPGVVDSVKAQSSESTETQDFDSATGTLNVDGFNLAATTGIALDDSTQQADFEGKSFAACEMVNRTRGFLFFAAAADQAACDLSFILGTNESYYDGEFHVVEITGEEDGESFSERIRFKLDGTSETITGMTVQTCEDGQQTMYVKKEVDADGNVTINAKRKADPENPQVQSFVGQVSVTGQVDSNQNYVGIKTIESSYSNQFTNGTSNFVQEVVKQSAKNIFYTGFMYSSDADPDRLAGFIQMIDNNQSGQEFRLDNYRLGDGAMAMSLKGDALIVQGWDGDTKDIDGSVEMFDKVSALQNDLPTEPSDTYTTLSFDGEEAYDCSGDADITINDADLEAAIETLGLRFLNGDGQSGEEYGEYGNGEGEEDDICSGYYLPQNSYLDCNDGAVKN